MNKYEHNLLQNSSRLDAVTNSDGNITSCAKAVIENQDEAARQLCHCIALASDLKDPQITKIAIATKDALVSFVGQKMLSGILSKTEAETEHFTLEELMLQLNQLVGLQSVKSKVGDLIAYHKVRKMREAKGLRSPKGTMHMAFTGNPGTGKTTVARIVGRLYKGLGLLSKGHFLEVSRTDLIAGYQGQTAHKVKNVITKAKGGVLFIDEAYSITENDRSDSYGRECLTELTKALEDYREDLVVIVAGYTEPMNQFFASNPGLKSRFNTFIEFEDYDADELMAILISMAQKEDYQIDAKAQEALSQLFAQSLKSCEMSTANGRFVRNIFETMVVNQARRIVKQGLSSVEDLRVLSVEDVQLDGFADAAVSKA